MQVNFWHANYRESEHELMQELKQIETLIDAEEARISWYGGRISPYVIYAFEQGPLPEAVNAAYPRGNTHLIKLVYQNLSIKAQVFPVIILT